ncbi:MAG: 50S ribosomal protein L10 [Dehalococcoidia bacterium]|jgi:large subunit ribosomal protein L10|nr:MAG: 50S ribosomal protein L10 [Dehalococcoidia bacterium]
MTTKKKPQIVDQLAELLSRSKFVIATDYRGLTVAEMSELRHQLRNIGTEYHVVKNRLAKFAAENAGKQELSQLLTGPTALAFGHEDIPQLAKALADYIRISKTTLTIKGGLIDGQLIGSEEVKSLATLPSIEVMRAKLLGMLLGPIFSLQNVLSANLRGLNSVLNARIQQLGGTIDV